MSLYEAVSAFPEEQQVRFLAKAAEAFEKGDLWFCRKRCAEDEGTTGTSKQLRKSNMLCTVSDCDMEVDNGIERVTESGRTR